MEITPDQVCVRLSPIHSQGLFAETSIPIGSTIEYTGVRRTAKEIDLSNRYLFRLNNRVSIDGSELGNLARYINHSCMPNCYATGKDKIIVTTGRDIRAGEELTLDYGPDYFNMYIRPNGCRCPYCSDPRPDVRIDRTGMLLISPSGVSIGVRWTYEQQQQLAAWFDPPAQP